MIDRQYEDLLRRVMQSGASKEDRTGTGTRSVFGAQLRYDLSQGFPLITTKRVSFRAIVVELLWMLRGDTNVKYLHEYGVHIWDDWADCNGELGPIYGAQWRKWRKWQPSSVHRSEPIDQIQNVLDLLRSDPHSRRMIVSAWNVGELDDMALMPCHAMFQAYVADGKLSLQVYQRSADLFLGVPFNIASYALLTHMFAQYAGIEVGDLIWTGGDCHIYNNHFEQVTTQLDRAPYAFPNLEMVKSSDFFNYSPSEFWLNDYFCHPTIKAPIAI